MAFDLTPFRPDVQKLNPAHTLHFITLLFPTIALPPSMLRRRVNFSDFENNTTCPRARVMPLPLRSGPEGACAVAGRIQ